MPMDDHDRTAAFWALSPRAPAGSHDEPSGAAWMRPRDRRMGVLPPVRSQPIHDLESITRLITVAAALLHNERHGAAFSLEQLMKKIRELLRPGRTLAADDVRAVLPGMAQCLAATRGRWRWQPRGAA